MSAKDTFEGLVGLVMLGAGAYYFDIGGFQQFVDSRLPSGRAVTELRSKMPPDQIALIDTVIAGRERYRNAANDMAKGEARVWRKGQLCSTIEHFGFADWYGVVEELSSNNAGLGVLTVSIADDVSVGTWNNSISDIGSGTLIEPTSPVFNAAMNLHEGDIVRFSGTLIDSDNDCIGEQSMTQSGSMMEPEFTVRFNFVQRQEPAPES